MRINSIQTFDVYNKKYDFFTFVLPLFLSFFLMYFFYNSTIDVNHLVYLIIFKVIINQWHVFFTMFLTLEQSKIGVFLRQQKWIVLLLAIVWPILGFFNLSLFKTIVGYFGLFHVIMQLYGFMRIMDKKANDGFNAFLGQMFFWTTIIISFAYWFQGYSKVSLTYFFYNNLIKLPPFLSPLLGSTVMYFFGILFCLNQIKIFLENRTINLGHIYILATTWIVFYFGLVLSQSNNLFYLLSLTFHGVTYIGHVVYAKKKINNEKLINNYFNVGITIGGASLWTYSLLYLVSIPSLIPMIYLPLILHFIFDGYFWKKNRIARFGENAPA